MADLLYNFLDDNFTVYEPVETPKVTITYPLSDDPIDIPWASRVLDSGTPIVKNNIPQIINNNSESVEIIPTETITTTDTEVNTKSNFTPIIPKNQWVKDLSEAYRKLGISENGIRNLIAKNALESNWGKSAQGRFNYGNITTGKSWKGDYVNGRDKDAKGNPIRNKFRSYNSLEEFAKDEVEFLRRLYDFDDSDSIETFANKLKGNNKGKRQYAESPKYKSALINFYKQL